MSEWTMVTLKEHLEKLLAGEVELRRARREDDLRLADQQNVSMNMRLDVMNRFRSQMQEERDTFVRSDYLDEQIKAGLIRHDTVNQRLSTVERIQFKIIGGLVLATFVVPVITGLVVYLLTRHAITTSP